jgi:cellobiose phosphorylase
MRYGRFDDKKREYVITRPDTPLPWINYLGCQDFFGIISNTAGGYSFYQDARLRRITRYRYNNVPFDMGGRYIYLRDNAKGEFWSPSWMPVRKPVEKYSCRHGLGYSIIGSTHGGIEAQTRYFVPLDETLEIWAVTLTNRRKTAANLSLFSAVEFCLWDAHDDATNLQRNLNIGEVEVQDNVIYHKTEYRERRDHFAFFACSEKQAGFDTQREAFLGPYRGWDNPQAVEKGRSANSVAHGWSPIGSYQIKISLRPGQSRQVIFLLGYSENPKSEKFDPPDSQTVNKRRVTPVIRKYLQSKPVEEAFQTLGKYWEGVLARMRVDTPDVHTNRMVNIWNAYQSVVTFNLSRSASFFETGVGRGMGFRDSNQDLLAFTSLDPARGRQRILDLAATQLQTGGAFHQYQPLTKRGNNDVGGGFNDDPLWLVLSVTGYIAETGDESILEEQVSYENRPEWKKPIYDHLQRSLQYTMQRLGPHGLPLIGRADWNDCLNLNCFSDTPGQSFQTTTNKDGLVAESVFIAGLFVLAAREMARLADFRGNSREAGRYRGMADKMESTIMRHGWDGEWFVRAYDDQSRKLGSRECKEGQIFIEPQGICVMADIGLEDGKALKAMQSVNKRLSTRHGIVLQQPAYTRYYLEYGEISSYPQGYKENAGIFCHTNPWIMIAETRLGNGDRAFDYYQRINPSAREVISEVHRVEPYVYAQMIAGRDAPTHGEAKNSWLSGTAAWNYVAITQYILGIRPTLTGLRIAPVIPSAWTGFKASRIFRGVTYRINVKRAGPGNRVSLLVDGKKIAGDIVPLPPAGTKEISAEVLIS